MTPTYLLVLNLGDTGTTRIVLNPYTLSFTNFTLAKSFKKDFLPYALLNTKFIIGVQIILFIYTLMMYLFNNPSQSGSAAIIIAEVCFGLIIYHFALAFTKNHETAPGSLTLSALLLGLIAVIILGVLSSQDNSILYLGYLFVVYCSSAINIMFVFFFNAAYFLYLIIL